MPEFYSVEACFALLNDYSGLHTPQHAFELGLTRYDLSKDSELQRFLLDKRRGNLLAKAVTGAVHDAEANTLNLMMNLSADHSSTLEHRFGLVDNQRRPIDSVVALSKISKSSVIRRIHIAKRILAPYFLLDSTIRSFNFTIPNENPFFTGVVD